MKLSELIWDEASNFGGDKNGLAQAITARLHECVRPLEWREDELSGHLMSGIYEINTQTNELFVYENDIGMCSEHELMNWPPMKNDTLDTAKAAAQAHYASQIIAGLDL